MILNFYYTLLWVTYTFIICIFLNLFTFKFLETSYINSLILKITLDNFYFFNFYFIWSNFFYMFVFFSLYSLLFFFFKNFRISARLFFKMSFINIILYFNIIEYFFFNAYNFNLEFLLCDYNILLNNTINKIHPIILYTSLYYVFYSYFIFKWTNIYMHTNFNFLKFIYTTSICFNYTFFTIFLGSLWAFQEGSWGGWWDWDVSEVFGLFLMLNIAKLFHKNYVNVTKASVSFELFNCICYLSIFYFFMQLNFSLISHNFNLNFLPVFTSNFFYLCCIFFL